MYLLIYALSHTTVEKRKIVGKKSSLIKIRGVYLLALEKKQCIK